MPITEIPLEAIEAGAMEFTRSFSGAVVYFLIDRGECVYVGRTKHFRYRMRQHARRKPFNAVRYIPTSDPAEAVAIEATWIRRLNPPLNTRGTVPQATARTRETAVVPIYIRPEDKDRFEKDRLAAGSMPQWSWFARTYRVQGPIERPKQGVRK